MTGKPEHGKAAAEALDALEELAWAVGMTPVMGHELQYHPEESEAAQRAAGDFIQEMIAQAEQHALNNRTPAVCAALIEAWSWLFHLADQDNLGYLDYYGLPDDLDDDDLDDDRRPPGYTVLSQAQERLGQAALRYAEHLRRWDPERMDGMPLLGPWRSAVAPPGYIAMLRHHLDALSREGQSTLAQGHSLAARDMAASLKHQLNKLNRMGRTGTGGSRPSNRQMQRCMNSIRRALQEFSQAEDLIRRTRPVRFHPEMDHDRLDRGWELAGRLAEGEEKYTISLDPDRPQESIIAYDGGWCIRVKRIIDHYEEDGQDTWGIAMEHALALMSMTEEDPTGQRRRLAEMLHDNVAMGMHGVDRDEFLMMVESMRRANGDPLAVREAATEALCGSSGLDLLFALAEEERAATAEQAQAVIGAARAAGLNEGLMRSICRVMNADPGTVGVAGPQANPEDIAEALEMCPAALLPH